MTLPDQPERGEFVPVRLPHDRQPPGGPSTAWSPQPWFTPMPQVRMDASPPPRAVRVAGWLWLAASLLYLAGWVVATVVDFPLLVADFAADPDFDSEDQARVTAAIMLVFAVLAVASISTGYAALGFLLWRRRNWARVLLAVLGVAMLVVILLDVLIGLAWRSDSDLDGRWRGYGVLLAASAAQFALTVAAIVAMFRPAANRFMAGAPG